MDESTREVVYSTVSPDELSKRVLRNYTLGPEPKCELFLRGINDTYLVRSADRRFVLRLYRHAGRSPGWISFELEALAHLAARGVDVALPIPRDDGLLMSAVAAPEGSRQAVLFAWVPGELPEYGNAEHAAAFGRTAALLHSAGDGFAPSVPPRRLGIDELLRSPAALTLASIDEKDMLRRWGVVVEQLSERLDRLEARGLDCGLCHGDLHGGNAHVTGDTVTLFDFDFCGFGWRAYDLATYRWAACLRGKQDAAWQPFIDAYLAARPFSKADIESVPTFVAVRHMWLMGLYASDAQYGGTSFQTNAHFERNIGFLEQLMIEGE